LGPENDLSYYAATSMTKKKVYFFDSEGLFTLAKFVALLPAKYFLHLKKTSFERFSPLYEWDQ
jgi:hypothetical protein